MSLILSGTDGLSDVDGSAATPAIRGTDANTGIFFPAADTIAFSEGGVEAMRIDSDGDVGIGTASPAAKLDVRGSSTFLVNAANPTAWISVDSALTTGSIYSQWNTSTNEGIFGSYTNHPIYFVTNNTRRLTIDTSGNVGIGNTPSGPFKLEVTGATSTSYCNLNANISAPAVDAAIYRPADGTLGFVTNAAERMRITSAGLLQFNNGYGSVATAYGCRAWVNFQGNANTNLSGTYSRTSPSTTLTVTATAHGLIVGNIISLDFTSGTGLDGVYTVVTVADANTFTITTVASTTTSGNVTILRNTIRASGNVSSISDNGTGDFTINFTTAMPDANYAVAGSQGGGNNYIMRTYEDLTARTANAFRVIMQNSTFNAADPIQANFAIFR